MRIQHNIMAMSAYRNYTNNVSAMKKNLEKLSSGYKINRAGDDAAGLAISEKMRAQITGLETAQKNAKDGISLVQTAEGALTEVHDMLNRMVELATMSANGTYDNTTDRAQLQKEMDQLNSEINRIADSANFNGIKLLDGSMDANGIVRGTEIAADDGSPVYFQPNSGTASGVSKIPAVGTTLGVDTKLHIGTAAGTHGTEFAVDLHEVKFDAKKGDELTVSLGTGSKAVHIKLTALADASKAMTADDITKAILAGGSAGKYKVEYATGSNAATATYNAPTTAGKIQINGSDFTLSAANGRLSFKQDAVPDAQSKEVLGGMDVKVTSTINKPTIGGSITTGTISETTPGAGGGTPATAVYTADFDGISSIAAGTFKLNIAGKDIEITFTDAEASAASDATKAATAVASKVAAALNSAGTIEDGLGGNYTIAANAKTVTFTASANGTIASDNAITGTVALPVSTDTRSTTGTTQASSGDYNVRTTDVKNVAYGGNEQLASTKISLDASKIVDGGAIIIGGDEYEFSAASADKSTAGKVYIGDLGPAKDGKNLTTTDLQEVARRITDAAANNATWTVGTAKDGALTLVEKTNAAGKATGNDAAKGYLTGGLDLTTEKGIAATLGWRGVETAAYAGDSGKALTLQIGDTADKYNQLEVNIKDMHTDMLGKAYQSDGKTLDTSVEGYDLTLKTISIAKQSDAAKAVDVIKRAINQVSDLRGTLGATQNRLDHTINNLSVMTENIQDAESTIRDVDVAEEMMAYTKNNILIQSAQAMLAQANQVPQGVLQLLQ